MDRDRVRALNDAFRQSLKGGEVFITSSLANHPKLGAILHSVRTFDAFGEHNDPYKEHDFGSFFIEGEADQLFWKIDYYDRDQVQSSLDPAVPEITLRVLTVMRASEY